MIIKKCRRASETIGVSIVLASVAGCNHTPTHNGDPNNSVPGQVQIDPVTSVPSPATLMEPFCSETAIGPSQGTTGAGGPQPATSVKDPTRVTASHSPLYNIKAHKSTITATASNSIAGLDSIELVVTVGQMTDCSELDGEAMPIPCRAAGPAEYSCMCSYSGNSEPKGCSLEIDITDGSLVTYFARATPSSGAPVTSQEITYSGGQPLEFVAAPIWWHTGEPAGQPSSSRISLGLFPDWLDFEKILDQFSSDVSKAVDNAFFNSDQEFAKKYTDNRYFFDIWVVPFEGADAKDNCERTFSDDLLTVKKLMRGSAIFHKGDFDDCATILADGQGHGSVGVKKSKPDWLLVHESAHFLFGLADEYAASGTPAAAVSDPPNIFFAGPDCDIAVANYSNGTCDEFITGVAWRIDDKNTETMKEEAYTSSFHNTSDVAIDNRIGQCKAGDCY